MSKELSTKVVTLDLDVILANYNKPAFWKKTWTIFKNEDLTLIAKITQIDVISGFIYMIIKPESSYYTDKKSKKQVYIHWCYDTITIPFNEGHEYTKEKFQSDVLANCIKVITSIESQLIEKYSEYQRAREVKLEYRRTLTTIAENFLDEHNVTNKEIREAYISYYLNKSDIPDYTTKVLENYRYTVIPYQYLMCAAFIGDRAKYDKIAEKCNKTRKSTKINIWLKMQELKSEEFTKAMEANLEAI